MKELKGVQGTQAKVEEIEFNVDTIYIRSNIEKKIKIDEQTQEKKEYWQYDEKQYSFNEYVALLNTKVESLEKENIELKRTNAEQDLMISELAMI